jgi:kumamolisin
MFRSLVDGGAYVAKRSIALGASLILGVCLFGNWHQAAAQGRNELTPSAMIPGHTLSTPTTAARLHSTVALESTSLTLTITLRRADEAGFAAYLRDVYDPASARYRAFLSQVELSDRFGPSQQDFAAVLDYFREHGFTALEVSPNRLTFSVSATRQAIAQALNVRMQDYQAGGRAFFAPDRNPSLPMPLASRVISIGGLSNLAVPRAMKAELDRINNQLRPIGESAPRPDEPPGPHVPEYDPDCGAEPGGGHCDPRTPNDGPLPLDLILRTTLAKSVTAKSYTTYPDGTGQKVGLLEFDTFVASDVADTFKLFLDPRDPLQQLSQVHVNGGASLGASQSEVLLDIVTVMTVAKGANVVVYDAPPNTTYQQIFNAMINGGVSVISNSWSSCEDQVPMADALSIDAILQAAAASGISVFNGTGDTGATCLDGAPNTIGVPADSPHATAVGGSSLKVGLGFLYVGETWWNDTSGPIPGGQGGFGVSKYFPRPSFQNGLAASATRSVPDVVINADPIYGAILCQASDGGCPTRKLYGGTSMATPYWAAIAATINQRSNSNIGDFNAVLYPLANTIAFHSAAALGSDFAHVGLGSPKINKIGQLLAGASPGPGNAVKSGVVYASTVINLTQLYPLRNVPADGQAIATIVVVLRDAAGRTLPGKTVQLALNAVSHATISPSTAVTSADQGAVVFSLTDLTPETVTVTATDVTDNVVLTDQPQIVFGVPAATSAGITAAPTTVAADGATTTTITVTLKDTLNRPTPGKAISISQGSGHSIITGPNPAVTDANGQIQFAATDTVTETVTYTAVDVSDGNLPVPGSATVNFTGGIASCLPAPPTAANGFTLTPFANGFVAQNFFYANINFVGCPGVSNPAFDTTGSMFVADFPTGDLYKMPPTGGAASNANKLSNLGKTFGNVVFGKDGNLYGTTFSPASVVQVDPTTGAIVRTVASGYSCPNGLAVDPLSGDLFFDDNCVGGIQDASLWRVQNPASASPTVVVYTTLPGFGNGQLAFAPDGTLFAVASAFNNATAPVVRISGTNAPAPHAPVPLSGITSDTGGLAIGQVQANGAAKSLIVHSGGSAGGAGGSLKMIDLGTLAATVLANGLVEPGVVAPDGCMYVNSHDTILKLAPSAGGCGFIPTNPSPALVLSPASVSPNPAQGSVITLTATFNNLTVAAGTPVFFSIVGANSDSRMARTNASGVATTSYLGVATGADSIVATAQVGNSTLSSNTASITWIAGHHATFMTLNLSPNQGRPGQPVTLVASLADISVVPPAAVAGVNITFSIANQSCIGTTNAQGITSCTLTVPSASAPTLSASFAGNGQYAPAAQSELFLLVASVASPPDAPTIGPVTAGNAQASVSFVTPSNDGGAPITSYTATCTPQSGGAPVSASGAGSPIVVQGLMNGVSYVCSVTAVNSAGPGPASLASSPVTPGAAPPAVITVVPTLSELGMALLIAFTAMAGALTLRRRGRGC